MRIELRRAISRYVAPNYTVSYAPEKEAIITVGLSEALDLACRALLNPGDKVMYHQPAACYSPSITLSFLGKILLFGRNIFNPTLVGRSIKKMIWA